MDDVLNTTKEIGLWIYGYCTDFVINVANLTGISYYEINALLFCFLWPVMTLALFIWFCYLKLQIKIQVNADTKYAN